MFILIEHQLLIQTTRMTRLYKLIHIIHTPFLLWLSYDSCVCVCASPLFSLSFLFSFCFFAEMTIHFEFKWLNDLFFENKKLIAVENIMKTYNKNCCIFIMNISLIRFDCGQFVKFCKSMTHVQKNYDFTVLFGKIKIVFTTFKLDLIRKQKI